MSQKKVSKAITSKLSALLDLNSSVQNAELLSSLKAYLNLVNRHLEEEFVKGTNVRNLIQDKSRYIDKMLITLWQHLNLDSEQCGQKLCLIAVGGYGRGELHPHSDIDLLVLSKDALSNKQEESVEQFISILWDCHLKIGQAVRTLEECVDLAKQDVTITTNIMESRLLFGSHTLFTELNRLSSPKHIWSAAEFFDAKTLEQKIRYRKYDGTSFDLEPNLKSSPGGLRDIQLLSWISMRTYYPKSLFQLIQQNIITKKEYYALMKCQLFLWRVRYALHLVSGKAEDRLLFDYQKTTAQKMGFKDTSNSLAVEKMMKRYYRSVLIIRNVSDILLQISAQRINSDNATETITDIDEYFRVINNRIDATIPECFVKEPQLLLKIFQHVALDNSLTGITARTLRAIQAARYKINSTFRNSLTNKKLFIDFWHILHTSSRAMFLMKRSGVLSDYLESFRQITGQMQYDMFHNYTVDEHTLFLLKNLTEFAAPENNDKFPLCSEIMQRQTNPEIIFIAGLFHDIGKGKGGDHSEIGANEARTFCERHKINEHDSALIEWLVANHLLMSLIAQKRDTSDPKVIKNFSDIVGSQQHLELLYILTVADIRATSNSLWNSWKDSLLKDLFTHTSRYLQQKTTETKPLWKTHQEEASSKLIEDGFELEAIEQQWAYLDEQYFSKRTPQAIAWQMRKILSSSQSQPTLVGIRTTSSRSGSEVFVYTKDKDNLFAALTATLNQKGLSIQAANIYTNMQGYCFDSFFVLDEQGNALSDAQTKNSIKQAIIDNIKNISKVNLQVQRRMPRQIKYFSVPTKVEFFTDEYTGYTRMELTARDQSGLLAAVGSAFKSTDTKLHDARITTLGEKVEDTFIISHRNNNPIEDKEHQSFIRKEIQRYIAKRANK